MRPLRLACIAMVASLGLFGCPEPVEMTDGGMTTKDAGTGVKPDAGTPKTDAGTMTADAGMMVTDAGMMTADAGTVDAGPGEIADFAKDLILNHSADPNPTTTEDKTFAPDTRDASKFPPAFFQ